MYMKFHSSSFWRDPEITDEFTPDQKLFYIWMFTNPAINQIGVFEFSMRIACLEVGYSSDTIETLIRFLTDKNKIIRDGREILVLTTFKHHFSKSPAFLSYIKKEIQKVSSNKIRSHVENDLVRLSNGEIEIEPSIEIPEEKAINIPFEVFWDAYDKKTDRDWCEKKWPRLKDNDRSEIMRIIPIYKKMETDRKFRKNPKTFINGRCWKDDEFHAKEIPIVSGDSTIKF